jgi:uncharacterized protein YbjT (DUF2867 family)/uncharacterized membrane protein YphA (DoxX/SURF4 family)
MRILVTGANGFIGSHIVAALRAAGHGVVAAVRDTADAARRLPGIAAIEIDFNRDLDTIYWLPRLDKIDAVVNCAGILQGTRRQSIEAVHAAGPKAMFEACKGAGVKLAIQISAVSADAAAGTDYAKTKLAAENHLRALDIDWVVLRPSLVYAEGSYGGSSMLRGLAAFPGVIPLPGKGDQPFQPIHVEDLARAVVEIVANPKLRRLSLDAVGPETLTLKAIVGRLRAWLGFRPAPTVTMPRWLVALGARWGDLTGGGPLNTTALRQIEYGNVSSSEVFAGQIGFRPRGMAEWMMLRPSHVQDRWHARLFLVRPVLRGTLALLWIISGLVGLLAPFASYAAIVAPLGLGAGTAGLFAWLTSLADITIGAAVLLRLAPRLVGWLQLAFVAGYTLVLTLLAPGLWLEPLGPLLKNLPIVAAVLALMAIESDR